MNRNGLAALVTPEKSILLLMDHQPFQLANLHGHEPQMIVNNVIALAKGAKAFGVPTILTTINASTGGALLPGILEVFPEQTPIDRTMINTWRDERVVKLVRESGRKKMIMAGLWTEICVVMPVIHAMGEGWDVTFVTDASGGVSFEAEGPTAGHHELGRLRWRAVDSSGKPLGVTGTDIAFVEDGRIAKLYVILDQS